ncbi:MAG: hypothetical protein FJ265_05175 [Planctomycetes bacterium]|nr:hypothetical protein [Planctomycetota bacterium]
MFRASLKVFLATALVALAAILVFAVLRLSGPEEALREAEAYFQRGEYRRTVAKLDLAERSPSLQRDPSKRNRLLRLRYAAQAAVENAPGALRDLEALLQQPGIDDPELRLDQIRLLAVAGQGERALQHAREFLARDPQDGRGLELAGEAMQTTYRDELAALLATVGRDLGVPEQQAASAALWGYLYRPAGDAEVQQGIELLREKYAARPAIHAAWPGLLRRLQDLRARIQQGLAWFQASLEAPGQPVAAMRGLALSLDQSERTDDLLLLCEAYRREFDHRYVVEAGTIATWALVRRGLPAAALATGARWLPRPELARRLDAGEPEAPLAELALARFAAAFRLGDVKALEQLGGDLSQIYDRKLQPGPVGGLVWGSHAHLRGNHKDVERNLRWPFQILARAPVPVGQVDLLPGLAPARIAALLATGADESEVAGVFAEWRNGRPGDLRPLLAIAEYQLQRNRPGASLVALDDADQIAPDDPAVFALRVRAADALHREAEQDGAGLLRQCLNRMVLVPEVAQPIGYLLCAEAALLAGHTDVARESARRAADRFPNQVRPRQILAEADLRAGRAAAAAARALALLDERPFDPDLASLALSAHLDAGTLPGGVLAAAMRSCPPSPRLTEAILRQALADERTDAAAFVPARLPPAAEAPQLHALAARVHAAAGRGKAARALLDALPAPAATQPTPPLGAGLAELLAATQQPAAGIPPALLADLAEASVATLQAAAGTTADADLAAQARKDLVRFGLLAAPAAPALRRGAETLAPTHPMAADALLTAALAAADPEQRDGQAHALSADLAVRLGQRRLAIERCTAAIAFPDGRSAAELLARLCLLDGQPSRAALAFRLAEAPTDPALAARLGNPELAVTLARQALADDGADLLAHVALRCLGMPSLADDLPVADDDARNGLLELASLLRVDALATAALPQATAIAAARPDAPTAQLLLLCALRLGGQGQLAASHCARLFAARSTSPLFWREVALAGGSGAFAVPAPIAEALSIAVARDQVAGSPVTRAYAYRRTAESFAAAGQPGVADQMRATLWLDFTTQSRPTLADAGTLVQAGRRLDAWWVLDRIRPTLRGRARAECIDLMFAVVEPLATSGAPATEQFLATARRLLAEEGPYGGIVHFLLRHGGRVPAMRLDEAAARDLLERHLLLAGAGRDREDLLEASVARLVADHGVAAAAHAVDRALAAHPTSLLLWRHRAVLGGSHLQPAQAVADLRAVLQHAEAPEQHLELVVLAAARFSLLPADTARLQQLPAPLLASPLGQLARGLVALRTGRPDEAAPLLAQAAPRPDGLHLQAYALALLQSRDPEATARAAAVLDRLAADYPSSSLARYAGSFARQLAGR